MTAKLSHAEFGALLRDKPARGRGWNERVKYAKAVLVDGRRPVDVAEDYGVTRQTVSRAATFFADRHAERTGQAQSKPTTSHPSEKPMILVVANHKGGVGKTALAAHLLFRAAEHGRRALAVDLDSQGNLTGTFVSRDDAIDRPSSAGIFATGEAPEPMPTECDGVDLLPASRLLDNVDKEQFAALFTARNHLNEYAKRYDVVIVDTPPALGLRLSAGLAAATGVITPLIPEMYSVDGIASLLSEVAGIRSNLNSELPEPTFVLNMVVPRSKQHEQVAEHLSEHFPINVRLGRHVAVAGALGNRSPVWRNQTHAGAAAEWRQACDVILSHYGLSLSEAVA